MAVTAQTQALPLVLAAGAVLTPVQQAKLRVFEVEVEHRIREMSRRARRQRTPQGQNNP